MDCIIEWSVLLFKLAGVEWTPHIFQRGGYPKLMGWDMEDIPPEVRRVPL